MSKRIVLVLGGVRSGKSAFAESIAERSLHPVYLATAEALDDELAARIELHRARRGSQWTTIESALDIADVIRAERSHDATLLVDSLGMWLGNLLHAGRELDGSLEDLLESLAASRGSVVLVSDEVGLGGIADNRLAREFADQIGRLNQAVAAAAHEVYLVVAGITTTLKS